MKILNFSETLWGDIPSAQNPAHQPTPREPAIMVYKTIPSIRSQSDAYAIVIIPTSGDIQVKAQAYDLETAGLIAGALARKEVSNGPA